MRSGPDLGSSVELSARHALNPAPIALGVIIDDDFSCPWLITIGLPKIFFPDITGF